MKSIYLDSAATTKPYEVVIDTIHDVLFNEWANPSSNNSESDRARFLIEKVRKQFAEDLNCSSEEIIFTGSGCESNSLAIMGFLWANLGFDLYISNLEHASLNELTYSLSAHKERFQFIDNLQWISNDKQGLVSVKELEKCLANGKNKPLVSISAANSEIGSIQDIKALAEVVHRYSGIMHCDAVQLFPEQRIDVKDWDVDMLSISPQKFGAGRGCGILYVKDGIKLSPIIYGSQENHLRGGSYNTAAICAAGKALEITRSMSQKHIRELRNSLLDQLLKIPGTHLNGPEIGKRRLSNNISLTIDGVDAEQLVTLCDLYGIVIARGSACQSHEPTPSQALLALGLSEEQALNTIRITLGHDNTEKEIEQAATIITKLVERVREDEQK